MEKTKNGKSKKTTMSRAREAGQQLAASYYGFDGSPEFMSSSSLYLVKQNHHHHHHHHHFCSPCLSLPHITTSSC